MAARDFPQTLADSLTEAGQLFADLFTPSLRLGVTGLSRAGKTVFITALIRNLTQGGRLPFFAPAAEGRLISAHLDPQPDDHIPRFDYEGHIGALSADPPEWPESTRRISEVRVALTFESAHPLRRALGLRRLNLDIVDYPGEWLLDLALLDQSYAAWSRDALERARLSSANGPARDWLAYADAVDANSPEDEQVALDGAHRFTHYLLET